MGGLPLLTPEALLMPQPLLTPHLMRPLIRSLLPTLPTLEALLALSALLTTHFMGCVPPRLAVRALLMPGWM